MTDVFIGENTLSKVQMSYLEVKVQQIRCEKVFRYYKAASKARLMNLEVKMQQLR